MLSQNKGGLLSFSCLLSTSTEQEVSIGFASNSLGKSGFVAVLFEMEIDPTITSTPFAVISTFSAIPSENEILFGMNTVFRIGQIEQMDSGIWRISL